MRVRILVSVVSSGAALTLLSACGSSTSSGGASGAGGHGTGGNTQTTAEDSSTPTGASGWRPFSDSSPWNTAIPNNPTLKSDSADLVNRFMTSSQWPFLSVNITGYSIPLYWADSSTQSYAMPVDYGGQGWQGSNTTANMPIPAQAEPDPQSDHHMLVISADRETEYGCWDVSHSGSSWHAGVCATADLTDTGVRPPAGVGNTQYWQAAGSRACGFPLVAGLIRVEEIKAGRIDHALVIGYPGIQNRYFTPPASTPSNGSGADIGVPCGGRLQYDPSVDVTTLGLSRAGQMILKALQEYGAYVGDYSGALSLYAENSPDAQTYFASGALDTYEFVDQNTNKTNIDLSKFRVIDYGPVYDVQ